MTEKNYAPSQKENKLTKQQDVKYDTPSAKAPKKEDKKEELKNKTEEKKESKKKPQKIKKSEAIVNAYSLPISTKVSGDICRFIKFKTIEQALKELQQIAELRKPLPMKGEYPHRKGRIMAGRYPKHAAEQFINIIKTLGANSSVNGIEEPIIVEAFANIASKPFARFGRWKRKRTHVTIRAIEKNKLKELKNKNKKKIGGSA